MTSIEYHVTGHADNCYKPLTLDILRSRDYLRKLERQAKNAFCRGLIRIFRDAHIMRIDEARAEAFDRIIEPNVEWVFEGTSETAYCRQAMAETVEQAIASMIRGLTSLVEEYQEQDKEEYESQFKDIY